MNRVIEFKRYHFDINGKLVHVSYWGKDINGSAFAMPSSVSTEDRGKAIDCQFSGLLDKNGKKIFERDLLKGSSDVYIYGQITPVEFYNGSFVVTILYDSMHVQLYDCEKVYKPSAYPKDKDKCDWLEEFEVIGNLYENPDLCNQYY